MAVLSVTSLKTATTYNAQVRAITAAGGTSQWSPTFSFTTVADTIPPNTPSTPVAVPYLGQIKVQWDGLDAFGDPMAKDFNIIEVHSSTTSGFTPDTLGGTLVGSMIGAGSFVHTDLIYGTTYYYRLVAVDRTGNSSPVASGQASAIPEQVVGPDILDGAVGSLKLADLAVVNAKIGDLAVNDAKVANLSGGKIIAATIQTDKLAVGVIRTNLPTNASFEDTTVPNSIGSFTALPGWVLIPNAGVKIPTQEVGSVFVPPVSGRGKITLACSNGTGGSSIQSDAFPLNPGDTYNWAMLTAGYGKITSRIQTANSATGPWTDHVNSMMESIDIIGTETQQFTLHTNVVNATTTNGTLATAFANGQTVDGVVLVTGNRILIKDQTTATENGVYTVNASGAPTRATDADGTGELAPGTGVYVTSGSTNGGRFWYLQSIQDTSNVVTNKALASNIATITTATSHGYTTGQQVLVQGVDATFNGLWVIASTPTATTFTYAVTASPVSSTPSAGTTLGAWYPGVVTTTWATIPYLHRSVRVCTQVNGTLASAFANGQTVDGIVLATGDRILLANQATGSENGIYTVNASGAPTRAVDADASGEIDVGHTVHVREGINTGGMYLTTLTVTASPWVPGTDTATFFPDATWNRISGQYVAPGGVTFGRLVVTNSNTSGDSLLYIDDILIMENNATGSEITSAGIRLFNGDGSETVRITGAPTGGTFINITGYDSSSHSSTTLASISDTGGGTFTTMDVDSLTVGGQDISTIVSGSKVIAWGTRQTSTVTPGTSEAAYMAVSATLLPGRIYRVFTDPFYIQGTGTVGTTNSACESILRYTTGTTAVTTSSTQMTSARIPIVVSNNAFTMTLGAIVDAGGLSVPTQYNFLATHRGTGGTMTTGIVASAALPFTMYVEDIGPSDPSVGDIGVDYSSSTALKKTYVSYWANKWSSSYFGSGGKNTYWGNNCVQGYYSSNNGNQKAMMGFNGGAYSGEVGAAITTALSGAAISKVEVYLYNYHWYYNAGGTAVIGCHGSTATSAPATFSGTSAKYNVGSWAVGAAKWVTLPNATLPYSGWASGSFRGITLGPGPSTSQSYYGGFYGFGSGHAPILRITYVK